MLTLFTAFYMGKYLIVLGTVFDYHDCVCISNVPAASQMYLVASTFVFLAPTGSFSIKSTLRLAALWIITSGCSK